ncbi:MAG: DNA repair protein RecN [Rhodospirillales bacterium]|nr:DNA repair protein RecN [Rhodospirillales bacterium]
MLKKLRIQQFVIIDKLDLDLDNGLTILTGETGAGKSILLDAMGQLLGNDCDPEAIRYGAEQAVIEGIFNPPPGSNIWKFLAGQGLASENDLEFTLQRTIMRVPPEAYEEEEPADEYDDYDDDGEEKAETEEKDNPYDLIRVNGRQVKLSLLKEIGTHLVEIHGQFANQSIMDPMNQLTWLDLYGNFPPEVFRNVAGALRDVHRYTKELDEETDFLATHKSELPKIESTVRKLEEYGMREGFVEEVQEEYQRLLTAKESCEAFQDIFAQLIAANGVVRGLTNANEILARQKNLDREKTADLAEYLNVALENTRAAVNDMRTLAPEYEIDTGPIYELEKILEDLQKISIEHNVDFEDLSAYYEELATKMRRIQNGPEKLKELNDLLINAKKGYLHHCKILTEKRTAAAKVLGDVITAEMAPLKLDKAEFKIRVEEKTTNEWTELGLNDITYMARMNPGQQFSPVADTASGGELARLILALKVVLQEIVTIPTLIFDEVDTGIGGAAAAAVGERIACLADKTQVLVITHSPQVASRGDQHLHVSKSTDGVTTTSVVHKLTLDQRIDEISRMLSGDTITEESRAAAKRLIDEAGDAAKVRRQALAAAEVQTEAPSPMEDTGSDQAEESAAPVGQNAAG